MPQMGMDDPTPAAIKKTLPIEIATSVVKRAHDRGITLDKAMEEAFMLWLAQQEE